MSFEEPGDGIRCDHCYKPTTLYANRGERLCFACLDIAVQAELNSPVGPMQVPAREYITPIAAKYRGY
jgi:hypothetical protein